MISFKICQYQRSSSPIGLSTWSLIFWSFIWLHQTSWLGWQKQNVIRNGTGHMTKISIIPIYGKNLIFSQMAHDIETNMQLLEFMYYQVCSNDNPSLILTFLFRWATWLSVFSTNHHHRVWVRLHLFCHIFNGKLFSCFPVCLPKGRFQNGVYS